MPTQQRARALVERLLSAAVRVLERDGYHGTTTRKIAAEAGVGVGSLYEYFPDKAALVAAIVDREVAAVRALIEDRAGQGLRPLAVGDLVRLLLDFVQGRGELARVLLSEKVDVLSQPAVRRLDELVHAYVKALLSRKRSARDEARAFVAVASLKGLLLNFAVAERRPDAASVAAAWVETVSPWLT